MLVTLGGDVERFFVLTARSEECKMSATYDQISWLDWYTLATAAAARKFERAEKSCRETEARMLASRTKLEEARKALFNSEGMAGAYRASTHLCRLPQD